MPALVRFNWSGSLEAGRGASSRTEMSLTLTTEDILTAFWRAFNSHDLDAVLSLLEEDVVLHAPAAPEPLVGKARVGAAWYLMFTFVAPDLAKEVVWTSVGERSGACEVIERGTMQVPPAMTQGGLWSDQRPYEVKMAVHFDLSEAGRISRIATYWDTGGLARQLGVDIGAIFEIHRKSIGIMA